VDVNAEKFRVGLEKFLRTAANDFFIKKTKTSLTAIKKQLNGIVDEDVTNAQSLFEPLLDDNPVFLYAAARVLQTIGSRQAGSVRKQKVDIADEEIVVVNGDLDVKSGIHNSYGLLVVLGNLNVGGNYIDEYHESHQSTAVVLGTFRASSILTGGEVMVRGDLQAADILFGDDNHHSLLVAGKVSAPLVVRHLDHNMQFGKSAIDLFFKGNASGANIKAKVRELLPGIACDNEYEGLDFDLAGLLARLNKRGRPSVQRG
jgi:hypothetical protein